MNSLDFLDIAAVDSQLAFPRYTLPKERKMKHKATGALRIDQFRAHILIDFPVAGYITRPFMLTEELNIGDETMHVNQWELYKGARVWPPVTAEEEETTEDPVVEPETPTPEPTVDPAPETPETPVEPQTDPQDGSITPP